MLLVIGVYRSAGDQLSSDPLTFLSAHLCNVGTHSCDLESFSFENVLKSASCVCHWLCVTVVMANCFIN